MCGYVYVCMRACICADMRARTKIHSKLFFCNLIEKLKAWVTIREFITAPSFVFSSFSSLPHHSLSLSSALFLFNFLWTNFHLFNVRIHSKNDSDKYCPFEWNDILLLIRVNVFDYMSFNIFYIQDVSVKVVISLF